MKKLMQKALTALAVGVGVTTAAQAGENPAIWYKFDGNYTASGSSSLSFSGEKAENWAPALNGQALRIVDGATHPYGGGWNFGSGAWAVTVSAVPVPNASNKIVLWTTGTKSGWFGLLSDSANGKAVLAYGNASGATEICSASVANLTSAFHLFTVRCDGSGNYELIVDNDLTGKVAAAYSATVPSGTYQIGAVNGGSPTGLARTTGTLIDDLRIYQRALADAEIGELTTALLVPSAEVIGVNIGGGRGTGELAANSDHLANSFCGLMPSVWNNIPYQWNSGGTSKEIAAGNVKASDGVNVLTRSAVSVYVSAKNTYDGGANRVNSFHKGYLDDGDYNGHKSYVKVSDVPYSLYDVIVYSATDSGNAKFGAVKVNGTAYTWADGATVAGTAAWGDSNATASEYGKNALCIAGIATGDVEIEGTSSGGRGGIAAVQIVNRGEIVETHRYTKTMTESCTLSSLFEAGELVEGLHTYVTVNVTATEPVTLTVDNPSVALARITVSSAVAFTLTSTADLANVADCDVSGVTGKLTLGTGCVKFAPSAMPAAGLRLEGTTPVAQLPCMSAGYTALLEIACPVTSVGNGGSFVGNKNIVFDEGCEIEDAKFSIGNENNTSQHFEQKGGTITLTDGANGQSNNGPMLLGHWKGADRWYRLTGGTLNAPNGVIRLGWDGGCALTVGGGEDESLLSAKGIRGGSERSTTGSSLTVAANGTVSLGANGIYIGTDNIPLTLAGGTISSYDFATVTKGTIDVTAPSTLAAEVGKTLTMKANFSGDSVVTVGTADETGTVFFPAGVPQNLTVAAGTAVFADRTQAPTVTGGSVGYYVTVNDLGSFTVPGDFDVGAVKLYNAAGEEVSITARDPATRTISFEMDRYGKSCLMEYLYEGNLSSTGVDTGAMQFDGTHCFTGAEYVTNDVGEVIGGIYAASAPWRNVSFPSEVTVVMYGKVMKTANTCQIGIGSTTGGSKYSLFLASGDVSKEEVVLGYAYNNSSANVEASGVLCRMTVPHAQTADHLYAFTLTQEGEKTLVKIYLDGEVLQPYEFDTTVTLGSGVQLGSIHGGIGLTQDWPDAFGFKRSTAVETEATLQFLRIYDGVLNDTVMRAIAQDYPYESPAGSFNRTFAGDEDWSTLSAWTKVGVQAKYREPEAGSAVTITPPETDMTLTVNIDETMSFEAFTANVGGKITVVRGEGNTGSLNVSGRSTISTDMTVDATVLTFGGNVAVAADKTLTFDCANVDLTRYYANDTIKLTGVPALGENAVITAINIPTASGRTAAFGYDASAQQYVLYVTVKGSLTAEIGAGTTAFSDLVWTMGGEVVTPDWNLVGKADLTVVGDATLDLDTAVAKAVTLEADNDIGVTKSVEGDVPFTLKVGTDKKVFVPVAAGVTLEALPCTIVGKIVKSGEGTLAVAMNRDYVVTGGTLKATAAGAVNVTVEGGAFDINGKSDGGYTVVLNGGKLLNGGNGIGVDKKQFVSISQTADSEIGGTGEFGYVLQGWGVNTLNLGGATLTKTGANVFTLCNSTVTNGAFVVEEGTLRIDKRAVTFTSDAALTIGASGVLNVKESLTIGTIEAEGGTLNNEGTVSAFTLTGSLKLASSGTYGTITLADGATLDVGQKRAVSVAGTGTVNVALTEAEFGGALPTTVFTAAEGASVTMGTITHNGVDVTAQCVVAGGQIVRIKTPTMFWVK